MSLESNFGTVNKKEAVREKIRNELEKIGIPVVPEIFEPLVIIEENSEFNDDSRDINEGAENLLEYEKSFQFTVTQKKRIRLAIYLHDIGKAGPSIEDLDCRLAVVKLFSKEGLNPKHTVNQVLQFYFPNEVDDMILNLIKAEVHPSMTMREFWNKHAFWTKEILDKNKDIIDEGTRKIAASHHLYNSDINPCKINIKDSNQVSNNEKFSIFLLMAMDVYQALVGRRGKLPHQKAMTLLRAKLELYDGDALMEIIIKAIDKLGATNSIFPHNESFLKTEKK